MNLMFTRLMCAALLSLPATAPALAQSPGAPAWLALQQLATSPGPNNYCTGRRVAAAADGSYYATGHYQGTLSLGSNTTISGGAGQAHLFLARYAADGTLLWVRQLEGGGVESEAYVAVDPTGGAYVTGFFERSLLLDGGSSLTTAADGDAFVARYSAQGALQWVRSGNATGSRAYGHALAVDAAGNVLVTGTFSGSLSFGGPALTGYGAMFLAKFGPTGTLLWSQQTTTPPTTTYGFCAPYDVALDAGGAAYVTGIISSDVSFGPLTLTAPAGRTDGDLFVAKFSPLGVAQWARREGNADEDYGNGISVDAAGRVAVAARIDASYNQGIQSGAIYTACYDGNNQGTRLWAQPVRPTGTSSINSQAYDVAWDGRGGLLCTGTFMGTAQFGSFPLTANFLDLFVVRYDAQGTALWVTKAGGTQPNEGAGAWNMDLDPAGNAYLAGSLVGQVAFGPWLASGSSQNSMFVAKLGTGTALSARPAASTALLRPYPNPVTGSFELELPVGAARLQLLDAQGRAARTQATPRGGGRQRVSVAGLAPGLYQLCLTLASGQQARATVAVQ